MKKAFLLIVLLSLILSACQRREIILVTTTSVENSGLLEYLLPYFEDAYQVNIKVIAVGTGAALRLGELGEADVLIVHDYAREVAFIEAGFGEKRDDLMHNDFIFVGPHPIESTDFTSFLMTLVSNYHFYSRGDYSGTHAKELELWETFGFSIATFGSRYRETGQSMESTLMMASTKGYFTLTDRGTYLAMRENLDLDIVFEGDELLLNYYGIIKVNPSLHNRDDSLADLFYTWMLSEEATSLIKNYTKYGEQLFHPYE